MVLTEGMPNYRSFDEHREGHLGRGSREIVCVEEHADFSVNCLTFETQARKIDTVDGGCIARTVALVNLGIRREVEETLETVLTMKNPRPVPK